MQIRTITGQNATKDSESRCNLQKMIFRPDKKCQKINAHTLQCGTACSSTESVLALKEKRNAKMAIFLIWIKQKITLFSKQAEGTPGMALNWGVRFWNILKYFEILFWKDFFAKYCSCEQCLGPDGACTLSLSKDQALNQVTAWNFRWRSQWRSMVVY